MKKLTPAEKLEIVKRIAIKKKIESSILISTSRNKKFMTITPNGKRVHFGQKNYEDFIDHGDLKRRANFHSRFKSNKGYNNPESALYYSSRLLW